jgi:hypothetical protein
MKGNLQSWIETSASKAKFFLHDLTRKSHQDVMAITEVTNGLVKGVIIVSHRGNDVGSHWWTTVDDLQDGLKLGYFDVTRVQPHTLGKYETAQPEPPPLTLKERQAGYPRRKK